MVTKTLEAKAGSIFNFFNDTGTKIPNTPATIIFKIIEIPINSERLISLNHNWTIIAVITLSLGASLTYIIANYFFKDLIKEKFSNKFKFLEEKIKSNEFFVIFCLRVIGGTPLQLQNLLPVFFNVKLKNYFFGSLSGFLPQAFVFSSLGSGLENQIKKNIETPSFFELITSFEIYGPIIAFFFLLILAFIARKLFFKN